MHTGSLNKFWVFFFYTSHIADPEAILEVQEAIAYVLRLKIGIGLWQLHPALPQLLPVLDLECKITFFFLDKPFRKLKKVQETWYRKQLPEHIGYWSSWTGTFEHVSSCYMCNN